MGMLTKRDQRMAWKSGKFFKLALSQLLPHKLSSALMLLLDLFAARFHSPGRSNCGCVSLAGWNSFFPWCTFTHRTLHEEGLAHQTALAQKTAAAHEILLWMWPMPLERANIRPLCHSSALGMWNFAVQFSQMDTWSLFLIPNTPTLEMLLFPLFPFITARSLLRTYFCSGADSYNLDFICWRITICQLPRGRKRIYPWRFGDLGVFNQPLEHTISQNRNWSTLGNQTGKSSNKMFREAACKCAEWEWKHLPIERKGLRLIIKMTSH